MGLVYAKNFYVDISNVDFQRRLKLSSLFDFFQDIADRAAASLGFGIETLRSQYNAAWVLTRIRADVCRTPALYEELSVETWPSRHGHLGFERDFVVRDRSGHPVAAAVSNWAVIDIGTRALVKADTIGYDLAETTRPRALPAQPARIRPDAQIQPVYMRPVGYSDTDFNGHINNSRYIDFAMDCFDLSVHKTHAVSSIEVGYLSETLPGDTLTLYKSGPAEIAGVHHIEGASRNTGKTAFRALVTMTPIAP